MAFLDSQGRAVSSRMQGREDIQMESRRDLLICSTPIRAKRNRSRLSQISRPSLRFSGPRSPGVSPVSLSTSYVGDYFSDADDFVEPNRSELDPQISTHDHNNRSRRYNRPQNFQAKMQKVGIKQAVLKRVPKACVSQRIERYKPLEIQSDSEEDEMIKRAKSRKKDSKKNVVISNSVYRKPIKDSGKGTDEAQMSIPATTSSKHRGFEESNHEYNVEVGLRRDLQKEMYADLNSHTNFPDQMKLSPRRLSNRKITNQRQDSGVSEIHGLTKNNIVDFVSSIQWKSGPAGYEPLVVVSDEEEEAVKKKGPGRSNKKRKVNDMSTCDENQKKAAQKTVKNRVLKWPNEGRKVLKDVVVNASFDDYEDDKDEESMKERVRNLRYHGSILEEAEDEYSDCAYVSQRMREEQRQNSLSKEASLSDDESCVSTHSNAITEISQGSPRIDDEGDNVEDVLNDSFCSNDKDSIYSGSVLVNHNDYALARERDLHLQNRENYQSAINKSGPHDPCTLNYDEEEDGFYEETGEFDDGMDVIRPLRDIQVSHRISGTLQEASDGEEVESLFNISGPVNRKSHSIQIQVASYNSHLIRINPQKGIANRRTVSHSCQSESFEESEKPVSDSGKKRGKAMTNKKPSLLVGKTEGPAKKKQTRSPVANANKAVAKPVKRNGGKKKAKLQKSIAALSDNSPHEKTSGTESPSMMKKTKNRTKKSPASSDNTSEGKGTARKRKSTGEGVAKEGEGTPKAKSDKEEGSEIATSSTKAGDQKVVKRKRGKPLKSSPTKSTRRKGNRKDANKQIEEQLSEDSSEPKVASKQKGRRKKPCENVPANRRSLHNPNKSKGLSFNNEENNSGNKSDSQHHFSPHPLIVRKNPAESSSDYLRKRVLTMRLGKSVCQKSLIDDEERLVTSTPLKPSSSRIMLNSSNKMPDVEIVIAGSTEKSDSQMIVKDSEVNKINETVGKIPNEGEAPKELQESKVSDPNREVSNKKEAENTFISQKHLENITSVDDDIPQIEKETLSEGKKSIEILETVKPAFERFTVNKILSDWPADEIHATSNEKLKNLPSTRNKINVLVNGKEKELEVFVEHSQIKFHKHKKQNIQYGPAINTSGYGSGFVHFTPGSDKGVSHAKQCNFIYLVLEGLVEVRIHESERLCKPGDFIVIPKGSKYNITGRGDKVSALVYFKCQGD